VLEDPLGLADYRAGIPPQLGQYAKPQDVARLGDFPALAAAAADIPRARRVVVPECGHIPHRIITGRTATSAGSKTA
jgi:hypothetical protein